MMSSEIIQESRYPFFEADAECIKRELAGCGGIRSYYFKSLSNGSTEINFELIGLSPEEPPVGNLKFSISVI